MGVPAVRLNLSPRVISLPRSRDRRVCPTLSARSRQPSALACSDALKSTRDWPRGWCSRARLPIRVPPSGSRSVGEVRVRAERG